MCGRKFLDSFLMEFVMVLVLMYIKTFTNPFNTKHYLI